MSLRTRILLAYSYIIPYDTGFHPGDKRRMEQILLNLPSNAIKFTESGSISVSRLRMHEMVRISVRDTGSGIEQEMMQIPFTPFPGDRFRYDTKVRGHRSWSFSLQKSGETAERISPGDEQAGEGSEFIGLLPGMVKT